MHYTLKRNEHAILILLFSLIVIIFKIIIEQDYFKYVLCLVIMPTLISIYFENCCERKISALRKIIFLFFTAECLIAIYERYTFTYVLYTIKDIDLDNIGENWGFRSAALLGHPLTNGMAVAVIMAFIVVSSIDLKIKLFFVILGYISLFCFNARGATIVVTFLVIPSLFVKMYKNRETYKNTLIVTASILITCISYSIFTTDWGGRLVNSERLIDGSAMTRLAAFSFYKFISVQDLLFGNIDNYLFLTRKLQAAGVENGLIVLMINFGVVLSLPLIFVLFRFHYNKLKVYKKKDRNIVLAVFYIIGLMNPNLSDPLQWTLFTFSYYAFRITSQENRYTIEHKVV